MNNTEMLMRVILEKIENLEGRFNELNENFNELDERFKRYEENYKPTQKNKIDINRYIKDRLGDSLEDKEVEKVKARVLIMFGANQWQQISTGELLSIRGMAIVDDSIESVIKFRKKEQINLFNEGTTLIEEDSNNRFPTL